MKYFRCIAIVKASDYFIFDMYNTYIVVSKSERAAIIQLSFVQNLSDIDTIEEINQSSAVALMAINTTKQLNEFVTQIIMY